MNDRVCPYPKHHIHIHDYITYCYMIRLYYINITYMAMYYDDVFLPYMCFPLLNRNTLKYN